jgi:hypothetical protein
MDMRASTTGACVSETMQRVTPASALVDEERAPLGDEARLGRSDESKSESLIAPLRN